ncbi:MAG: LPS assembly protein LptD, partial [Gammaproteobacteria bacterium]|nr:LPS assembly protein LptD [Gammaproteobacteria bacterium]
LLAALIAGLILPPIAGAQDNLTSPWNCLENPPGTWQCAPAGSTAAPVKAVPAATSTAAESAAPAVVPEAVVTPTAEPATAEVIPLPDASSATPSAVPVIPPSEAASANPAPDVPAPASMNAAEDSYNPWGLCGARSIPELPDADLVGTELSADKAESQGQIYVLIGNAVIDRDGRRVQADQIRYNELLGEVKADGNVHLDEAGLSVYGSSATLQLNSDQGEIHDVQYEVFSQHARGQAELARQESKTRKVFQKGTYTTCDANREAWRLNAREVTLHEDEGVGVARHTWLEIGDVPVFYTPYINFPIDDRRKSGLLVPSWGSSQNSGTEISAPYYWNIAPNYDATITPRVLSKRGLQMQTEFRYLQPGYSGQLDVEYLPRDSEYNDEDRTLVRINHSGRPLKRLTTEVHATNVSDDQYFEDLGTSLAISSTTHLERLAAATYYGNGWGLTGRVQDFQTVDSTILPANRPYKRLPQVLFNANPRTRPYGLELNLASEAVQFDHDDLVKGSRLDLKPMISLPLGGAAWFATPAAGVRYTQYNLDNQTSGLPDSPDRITPIASFDSGLFFDRSTSLLGKGMLQTLEPRAFYLYVPEKDQTDLPIFDTNLRDFNFSQMFEDNRFGGADRMGDANQLTLAATSRLLDPATGTQFASFSLGEIFYFRDREVTLPGAVAEEQSSSNIVAELDVRLSQSWKATGGILWDPHESKTNRSNVRFQYQPNDRHLWNVAYRFQTGELEQVDTSALWYFNPRWHGIMRWNYS